MLVELLVDAVSLLFCEDCVKSAVAAVVLFAKLLLIVVTIAAEDDGVALLLFGSRLRKCLKENVFCGCGAWVAKYG